MDDPLSNDIERIECADDGLRDRVADDYANSEDENGHLAPLVSGSLDPKPVLSGHCAAVSTGLIEKIRQQCYVSIVRYALIV